MRVAPPILRLVTEPRRALLIVSAVVAALLAASAQPCHAFQELTPLPRLAADAVLDRTSEDLIRARWSVTPPKTYPGQAAKLMLSVHVDERFLEEHMVQPFTRRLDLPIALDEPRIGEFEVDAWGIDFEESGGVLLALGDRLVRAAASDSQVLDGRRWRSVQLEARVTPTRAGRFELPAPIVRFAAAKTFREELLGRTPVEPRLAFARGDAHEWIVQAFPEAGRDPDFAGALGSYSISCSVDDEAPLLGDLIKLTVRIRGAALDDGALPRLDRLRGLHLVSNSVTREPNATTVRAELRVERATVREIPSIVLHSFDPRDERYLTAASDPIPLLISVPADAGRDTDSIQRFPRWIAGLLLCVGLGLLVWFRRRRSRAR